MAYGTESIPKCDKLFGPGNAWVTAAKRWWRGDPAGAAADLPAGVTEVMVIADEHAPRGVRRRRSAGPGRARPGRAGAPGHHVASARRRRAARRAASRSAPCRAGAILESSVREMRLLIVDSLERRARHRERLCARAPAARGARAAPLACARSTARARCSSAPGRRNPMGDYCSGPNHTLPTYGYARAYSGLSVEDFQKRITVQELSPSGLQGLGRHGANPGAPRRTGCARRRRRRAASLRSRSPPHEPVARARAPGHRRHQGLFACGLAARR